MDYLTHPCYPKALLACAYFDIKKKKKMSDPFSTLWLYRISVNKTIFNLNFKQ